MYIYIKGLRRGCIDSILQFTLTVWIQDTGYPYSWRAKVTLSQKQRFLMKLFLKHESYITLN